MKIRIGTRGSDLALWQAHTVSGWLTGDGDVEVELVVLKTQGDTIDDRPLSTVGGKDFFTAEIERALLCGDVDVAVHSHKDLATENPPGLVVAGVPERGPDRERLLVRPDAWRPDALFLPLAPGASVGTSAPRRREQLLALRPDLDVRMLRGNVPTRVTRLREGRYDAIVLAAAGLVRLELDLSGLEVASLAPETFVPAPAQGALAIQVRACPQGASADPRDRAILELVRARTHHEPTERAIAAERRVLSAAGGGCSLPLGASVRASGKGFVAHAFLGADHPAVGAPPRWVRATGATPDEATEHVIAALAKGRATGVGPLAGRRVALAGSGDEGRLAARLRALGAEVVLEGVLEFEDLPAPELSARVRALAGGDVLAVTSRRAAQRLEGMHVPPGVTVAAVGPTTADALAAAGLAVHVVGTAGAAELAREIPLEPGARVLFPCAAEARPDLPQGLAARGAHVEPLHLYRTRPMTGATGRGDVDARIYTSPSAVQALAAWDAKQAPGRTSRLALGRATWEALAAAGRDAGELPNGSGPDAASGDAASGDAAVAELARGLAALWSVVDAEHV